MRPNLVLINVGTNDCLQNIDVGNAGARLKTLIDYLYSALPSTTIIVSTLVPSATVDSCAQNVNNQYRNLVSQYSDSRIALADMHAFLTVNDIGPDGTHPTDFGYKKMAAVWWDAIKHVQDRIQPPDSSVDDTKVIGTNTCPKVSGNSPGPVQTQRGSGANDGGYTHSSKSHGSSLTVNDIGVENYHFGQFVNINGIDRGGETDELIVTEKHSDGMFSYAYRLNSGGSYASTWTNITSPVTCSGNVGESLLVSRWCRCNLRLTHVEPISSRIL